jgi:uncharacterized protein with ParB-like and HNH nuclease domain
MTTTVLEKSDFIIETDDDTLLEDSGEEGLYPYDPTEADIDIREDPQTVFELMRKYENGKLIIDPDFQRNLIWKLPQKSKFIESVILNFPLPPFYVNQTTEGKYIVVDGLQRTTTLHEFVNNEFNLQGLEALKKLNGYNFSALQNLSGDYQTKIEDKKLNLYVIRPSVPSKVVYDIFNRINTGGTNLQRQEVRNCIFLGKSTQLLKELAESDDFKIAINQGISPKRMKDREAVLRYLAFKNFDYKKDYQGDMSNFLERTMKKINTMQISKIQSLNHDFKRVMKLTYEFFGNKNFRLPTAQTRGIVNMAILESVAYFFSIENDLFLNQNKIQIIANFEKLIKNEDYLDSVKSATSSKAKVICRFNLAQEILGDLK